MTDPSRAPEGDISWQAHRLVQQRQDADRALLDYIMRLEAEVATKRGDVDRKAFGIVIPKTGRVIASSIRSTAQAALLCFWRDSKLSKEEFEAAGYRCCALDIFVRVHDPDHAALAEETAHAAE